LDGNNFYKCISFITFLFLVPGIVNAVEATALFSSETIIFEFNKPKGAIDYFEVNKTLTFYNYNNVSSAHISNLTVRVNNITGLTISPSKNNFSISPSQSTTLNLSLFINSNLTEGLRYGTIDITGTNVITSNPAITVEIIHPRSTINASWEQDWGNLKAGSNFSRILIVEEVMGYKSANNVSLSIIQNGPISLDYLGSIGNLLPFENISLEVKAAVPSHSLKPDSYPLIISFESSTNISKDFQNISYIIPTPEIFISNTTIDLGKVTFETGKETSQQIIFLQEIGGFTPIEGLSISLQSGEMGWLTYTIQDYVPPSETIQIPFNLFLPQDSTLGEKNWEFKLITDYAGTKTLTAKVFVYFPGVAEALYYLENVETPNELDQFKDIISSTALILEKTEGTNDTKKIVAVMSIYSGTRTFLSEVTSAIQNKEDGKIGKSGENIRRGHQSLIKMQVGNQNLDDSEFIEISDFSINSAEIAWKIVAYDILDKLNVAADEKKNTNYKLTIVYFKHISGIYGLLGKEVEAEKYLFKQQQMEQEYIQLLTRASENKNKGKSYYEKVIDRSFNIKESSFVINPFSFDSVSNNLINSIDNYKQAESLYRLSGELNEATLLQDKISKIEKKRSSIIRSFFILGSMYVLLFIGFLIRVSLAIQRFHLDEDETDLGKIVMKSENV